MRSSPKNNKVPIGRSRCRRIENGHVFDIDIDGYNTSVVDAYALVAGHVQKKPSICKMIAGDIPIHSSSKCEEASSIINKSHTTFTIV